MVSSSGYTFLNSIKNPVLIPLNNEFKNADYIEIQAVSGDFSILIPGKEYKKIKIFKLFIVLVNLTLIECWLFIS